MKLTGLRKKRELLDDIHEKVASGELKVGEKLLSTKELAEKYGIAIQTAQRLLSELVSSGILYRTPGKGTFIANQNKISPGRVVGLVMTCQGDIWGNFTASVSRQLQNTGINIMLVEADPETDSLLFMTEHSALLQLLSSNPLAIITRDSDLAKWISTNYPKIQTICLAGDRTDDFAGDTVCPDMYQAGYMGTKHLIEHGCKRICFYKIKREDIKLISTHYEWQLQCDGYCQAIKEAGLQEDIMMDTPEKLDERKIYSDKLKSSTPIDAILMNYDFRATQFIQIAQKIGVSIPDDLAVVSMYNTPWADSFKLTSIDLHYDLIAEKCVDIIINNSTRDNECSQVYKFKPEIVIRQSCGCS